MIFKNAQFSIVDIVFLIILFAGISSFIFFSFELPEKNYSLFLESGLNSIYYSQNFRDIIIAEDLSSQSLTQNWTLFNQTLVNMFNEFELIISNETTSKVIFSCEELSGKTFDERVISINNGTVFDFRKITLGVCY